MSETAVGDYQPADSCAFSLADFEDIMSADGPVDIERLREASRMGVPLAVRGEVWKHLLGVARPDHAENFAAQRRMQSEFVAIQQRALEDVDPVRRLSPDLLKQLRAEIRRHYTNLQRQLEETYEEWSESVSRGVFGMPGQHDADGTNVTASATEDSGDTTELSSCGSTVAASSAMTYDADRLLLLERLLVMYFSANNVEFQLSAVYLMSPFMHCMSDPCSIYFSFLSLQEYVEAIESVGIDRLLAKFMMLFRTFEPDLCSHFEDEELRPNEWALQWLRHLLSAELPFQCVLRLWDTYFARHADADLHVFVCLAILNLCKETLLECEHSELKASLQQLPNLDVDHLLALANTLQSQARNAWSSVFNNIT